MSSALGVEMFYQPAGHTSGTSCDKPGHVHHWPTQGQIMIERCEHYCLFCTGAKAQKRWSSAWFLRRHVRTAHASNEYPDLEISEGWERRPDGNARPLIKKRPPPGANRKRSKLLLMQRSPGMSTGNTPPLFLSTTPPANHQYVTTPALFMQTGNNIGVAYDAAGNLLYPNMPHGQNASPIYDNSTQSSISTDQATGYYNNTPATSFSDYNPNEVTDDDSVEARLCAALAPEYGAVDTAVTLQNTATSHDVQNFASAPQAATTLQDDATLFGTSAPELSFQDSTENMPLFAEGGYINPQALMINNLDPALGVETQDDLNTDFDISEFLADEATATEVQNVDPDFAAFANSAVSANTTAINDTNVSHELHDSYDTNDNTSSFGLSDLDLGFDLNDFDMISTEFTYDT